MLSSLAVHLLPSNWPSPRSEDAESCGNHPEAVDSLTGATRLWSTPQSFDATGIERSPEALARAKEKGGCANLREEVALWATPNSRDEKNPRSRETAKVRKSELGWTIDLNDQAAFWQTPATDSFRSWGGDRKDEMGLDQQSRFWTTPRASDPQTGHHYSNAMTGKSLSMDVSSFPPDQPTTKPGANCWCSAPGCGQRSHKRRLNPYFVEALMGLPLNWTSTTARTGSEPSGMPSARSREPLRSSNCSEESEARGEFG
jgi:DNA (cytosine-5)-methyltransferase 1